MPFTALKIFKEKKNDTCVLIWFLPAGKKIWCMSIHHFLVESVAEENLANHSSSPATLQCHYHHSCWSAADTRTQVFFSFSQRFWKLEHFERKSPFSGLTSAMNYQLRPIYVPVVPLHAETVIMCKLIQHKPSTLYFRSIEICM